MDKKHSARASYLRMLMQIRWVWYEGILHRSRKEDQSVGQFGPIEKKMKMQKIEVLIEGPS